jgi:hypothetical protein
MTDLTQGGLAVIEHLAPGRINVIENKNHQDGASDRWLRVYLLPEVGMKKVQALFTPEEVRIAVGRVAKQNGSLNGLRRPHSLLDRIQTAINDFLNRLKK